MSTAGRAKPDVTSDDDLKAYIMDTIARLELLARRLEQYAEERHAGEPASPADQVDHRPGEQAAS